MKKFLVSGCLSLIMTISVISGYETISNMRTESKVEANNIESNTETATETIIEEKGIDDVPTHITEEDISSEIEKSKEETETKSETENIVDVENDCSYQEYTIPSNSGFKSYMSYLAITSKSSPQYKLQNQFAYTGQYGIRQVDGRFCVAIGTFSNATVGTYVDLILENGIVIPCIVGDFKANVHTDSSNIITVHNGCVSEFLVDTSSLHTTAKKMGNISYCESGWNSPVKSIRVYDKNVFNVN
jgi:hypothetical protein